VLVNGLGATKWEELFALYGNINELLEAEGVVQVSTEVGELVTSLDMAGSSLSVTWLDDELEGYWVAPAETAAFRRGTAVTSEKFTTRRTGAGHVAEEVAAEASEESIAAATIARKAVDAIYAVVEENKEYLGRIDAIAGDGDHGIGMSRGSKAAAEAANETEGGVETVLSAAGRAFGDKAGGTSGILWGLLLEGVGKGLGNTEAVTSKRLADAVQASAQHLQGFSKAQLGDKTMLDALFPFVDTLVEQVDAGAPISEAWGSAADACTTAAEATASLVPKIGRARPLAERSVGTPDPGAVSLGLIVTAIGGVLGKAEAAAPGAAGSTNKEGQSV
jgi:D-erythrulose 4-kinase